MIGSEKVLVKSDMVEEKNAQYHVMLHPVQFWPRGLRYFTCNFTRRAHFSNVRPAVTIALGTAEASPLLIKTAPSLTMIDHHNCKFDNCRSQ